MDRYELRRLDYSLTEDHQALQAAYRDFFETHCPIETVRAAEESGFDKSLWERLCGMGATTMALPDTVGGDGATLVDLTLVAEEIGRSLAPVPWIENELPKHVEAGDSAYVPWMFFGVRGAAAPGGGGAEVKLAANGSPPSVPTIEAFGPGVAIASSFSDLPPDTQSTVPVRRCEFAGSVLALRRSCPPSVFWLLVKLTNCPDWSTLNDGPAAGTCVGAVGGSGMPPAGLGTGPTHGLAAERA